MSKVQICCEREQCLLYFIYSLPTGVVQIVLDVRNVLLNIIPSNKDITNYADLE